MRGHVDHARRHELRHPCSAQVPAGAPGDSTERARFFNADAFSQIASGSGLLRNLSTARSWLPTSGPIHDHQHARHSVSPPNRSALSGRLPSNHRPRERHHDEQTSRVWIQNQRSVSRDSDADAAGHHPRAATHFVSRTTKSGEGAAKPAVTAYSAPPNSAMVVGTFVDSFDVNGSVMKRTMAPDR